MTPLLKKTTASITAILASVSLYQAKGSDSCQVYIASSKDGIYLSQLELQSGQLATPKLEAPLSGAGFLAMHPNQAYLYATGDLKKNTGGVAAFSIKTDGALKELSRQSAQAKRLCHISLDNTSTTLMGANYGGGSVVSFPINKSGDVEPLASIHHHRGSSVNPKRQTKPHAHSIYPGPDNRFAYAADLGTDKVMIYSIDPGTAQLTAAGSADTPPGAGPRHMKFGKDGKQLYVLNELHLSISTFDRNATTGKLSNLRTVPLLPKDSDITSMSSSEIVISQDGKFIYCANRDLTEQKRDSLSVLSAGKNGQLTHLQTTHAEVWIPRNINLTPCGHWLLVAGQKSNSISIFKVDFQSGKLSYTGHKVAIPAPMCIKFLQKATTRGKSPN